MSSRDTGCSGEPQSAGGLEPQGAGVFAKRTLSRRDLLSIAIVATPLTLALVAAGGLELFSAAHPGDTVIVTDGDGNVWELPLDADSRTRISTDLGSNTVVIANGRVHIEEADCPGGDCMAHAPVSAAGQTIICLPHHLTVEIHANVRNSSRDIQKDSTVLDVSGDAASGTGESEASGVSEGEARRESGANSSANEDASPIDMMAD
jgi:hypothetical protein